MDKKQTEILTTKIDNLVNALEDIGIECSSVYTYTHCDNGRKCIGFDTNYCVWGEEVCFGWYLDTGTMV